jgi:hypothetical protein
VRRKYGPRLLLVVDDAPVNVRILTRMMSGFTVRSLFLLCFGCHVVVGACLQCVFCASLDAAAMTAG